MSHFRVSLKLFRLAEVVESLIRDTDDVWATRLMDRDQMPLKRCEASKRSRVTVLGDACHPMTCFKGQGANQALADAPLLAKCLSQSKGTTATRLRNFEREMVQRAAPRARASFDAARYLHSPASIEAVPGDSFAGFKGDTEALVRHLASKEVKVRRGQSADDLEAQIAQEVAAFRRDQETQAKRLKTEVDTAL